LLNSTHPKASSYQIIKSTEITEKAFQRAVALIREGVTEPEINRPYFTTVAEEGALPVFICIGGGYRSVFSNITATDYQFKKGDLIRYDSGCIYKYYYSDAARTAIVGKPTEKQSTYYRAIRAGEDRALELLRPGGRASEIFKEVVKRVRESGIPHYQRGNHVGHGIGIEGYAPPSSPRHPIKSLRKGWWYVSRFLTMRSGLGGSP